MSVNASVDHSPEQSRTSRARLPAVFLLMLFTTFFVGGATVSESSPASMGLLNVVTVVAFVGAMLTIAFTMIGIPRRH